MNPGVLPNTLIRSSSFLVESIGSSMYTIMSSMNNDGFTSSFPILIHFISSWLIAVSKTSSTMLNKSGKSGHPCLIPDLSGKAFSFCPLSIILAVGLLYVPFFCVEEFSLYSHFAELFSFLS